MFGNGGMVGTAVALSNALGLNRDPSSWNISPLEKSLRTRIWWLVVIHDRWYESMNMVKLIAADSYQQVQLGLRDSAANQPRTVRCTTSNRQRHLLCPFIAIPESRGIGICCPRNPDRGAGALFGACILCFQRPVPVTGDVIHGSRTNTQQLGRDDE